MNTKPTKRSIFSILAAVMMIAALAFPGQASLAAKPTTSCSDILAGLSLGREPEGWREQTRATVVSAVARSYTPDPERIVRFALGEAMPQLAGRVDATTVRAAVLQALAEKQHARLT